MEDSGIAIGLERGKVLVVPYDPRWPVLFEQEASLIRDRLGAVACEVAHMGSTAVPGLAAKPVLDILLAIPSLRAPALLHEALALLDYDHRPLDPLPDRLFFAKDSAFGRTHNLSVCEPGSKFWSAHLQFRDCLRADPALAQAYATLKHELAGRFPNDRIGYTDAKDTFVANALAASGWT